MNNFVFSQDPILYSSTIPSYQQPEAQDIKKQLDVVMAQYQTLQQNQNKSSMPSPAESQRPADHLGELDTMIANLDEDDIAILNNDAEFIQLNEFIQKSIQEEIVNTIKWKINSSQDKIDKINKLKEIINNVKKEKEIARNKSISEINDYIQNYSDMTFNEYKKIKQAKL